MRAGHHHHLAALALLGAILIAPQASAELTPGNNTKEVIVNGQRYEFTGYQGTFLDFDETYDAASLPWYNSQSTAETFANTVYGSPFLADGLIGQDAYYPYFVSGSTVSYVYYSPGGGGISQSTTNVGSERIYVNAVAVPEIDGAALAQGALAIAGIGLWCAGWRRQCTTELGLSSGGA